MLALTACVAQDIYVPPDLEQVHVRLFDIPQYTPVKVDILFVVDRSPAMESYEAGVRAALGQGLLDVLPRLRDQDFHLGVVSADLQEGGRLLQLGGAAYLTRRRLISGEYSANFTGDIDEVLPGFASLGHGGSAVPRPFDVVRLALDDNPYNAHFRRDNAVLLVVFIVAQDDHSAASPEDTARFLATLAPPGGVVVSVVRPVGASRIDQLPALFSNRSTSVQIDAQDFADCFVLLTLWGGRREGDPCIGVPLEGMDCEFSDVLIRRWETVLPACAGQLPCWEINRSAQLCPSPDNLLINVRRADYPPPGTRVIGQCVTL